VLLGDGIHLYDVAGGRILDLHLDGDTPTRSVDVRYRPAPRVT
jgi:hypothetical protein